MNNNFLKAIELVNDSKKEWKKKQFQTSEVKRKKACKLFYQEFKKSKKDNYLLTWLCECINLLQIWGWIGNPDERETEENINTKRYYHLAKAVLIADYLLINYYSELKILLEEQNQKIDYFERGIFHFRKQLIENHGCRMPVKGNHFFNTCSIFKEENRYHNLLNWYLSTKASYDLFCNICNKNMLESGCSHSNLSVINYQIYNIAIVTNPENKGTGLIWSNGRYELDWITRNKDELEKIKQGELEIHCHYCQAYDLDHSKVSINDWINHQQLDRNYVDILIKSGCL